MPEFYEYNENELRDMENELMIERNQYDPDDEEYLRIGTELREIDAQIEELEA